MRKTFLMFVCLLSIMLKAQNNFTGVYVNDDTPKTILEKPGIRDIAGGTVINVGYVGNGFNNKIKGAFEHACRLWEEKIPTTYPIKLSVKFATIANPQCLATVSVNYSNRDFENYDKVYDKRLRQLRPYWEYPSIEYLRDEPDATITFTSRKVFDYNINGNEISDSKYDFVTVAIQAIGKAVGLMSMASCDGEILERLPLHNRFSDFMLSYDSVWNYQYATSGNASMMQWPIYSPADYDARFSLSYFKKDPSNEETLFIQPGIAKGSVIRYIGKSMDDFFDMCGWNDYEIATGIGTSGLPEITPASTGDVIPFQGTRKSNAVQKVPAKSQSDENELQEYLYNMAELGADGNFVLMKDGSWKEYHDYREFSEDEDYARTSDGYVRLKNVYYTYGPNYNYSNAHAEFRLYHFPPQKPEASMNSYTRSTEFSAMQMSPRRNAIVVRADDDEYLDVEIGFKNTEGCTEILVEQTDSDYPVPYTYFVDVNAGCFTAYMNKKYPSTFKLTYYNEAGENVGEPFTINLRDDISRRFDWEATLVGDELLYRFDIAEKVDLSKAELVLTKIDEPTIRFKSKMTKAVGNVDISLLPKGAYIFTAIIEGEVYSCKFVK